MWPQQLLGVRRTGSGWPPAHTNLAGLGVDVAHAEEPPDHAHVVLLLDSRQRCQHERGVAGFVLVVHVTDPCGEGGAGSQGAAGGMERALCPAATLPRVL